MGDIFAIRRLAIHQLEAELKRIHNDKESLRLLAAEGPEGIEKEIIRLDSREAQILEEIAAEQKKMHEDCS